MNRVPHRTIEPYPDPQLVNGAVQAGLKGTLSTRTPLVNIQGYNSFGPNYNLDNWNPQKNALTAEMDWMKGKPRPEVWLGIASENSMEYFPAPTEEQGTFSILRTRKLACQGLPRRVPGTPATCSARLILPALFLPRLRRSATGGIAFFAQDSWRVTHKLTVNAGLRWDLFIPLHLLDNKMSTFNPTLPNPGAGGLLGALQLYGTQPGENGLIDSANYYYKAFDPKIGFAYQVNNKTVFRASYGISYLPYYQKFAGDLKAKVPQDGWSTTRTSSTLDSGVTPAFQLGRHRVSR